MHIQIQCFFKSFVNLVLYLLFLLHYLIITTRHAPLIMAEEELDYMSDVFITELSDTKNKGRKRPSQTNKIIKTKKQLKHELESTVRTQGLATPISEDNKGFEMLHKMGYRPGGALGKSGLS